jgi:hypothetical protein
MFYSCNPGSGKTPLAASSTSLILPDRPGFLPDTVFSSITDNMEYIVFLRDSFSRAALSATDAYDSSLGVLTFRGNGYRNAPYYVEIDGIPKDICVDWYFKTEDNSNEQELEEWGGGTGWTGQPLIVNWPAAMKDTFTGVSADFKQSPHTHELIFGSLCGKVYFLNPESGVESRPAIAAGGPIKGTPSLDPLLTGLLLVGQGIPDSTQFGFRIFNIFSGSLLTYFSGRDRHALRGWGAFDSSPLRIGDFFFWPGENGLLYKFSFMKGAFSLHSKLRYKVKNNSHQGIESSMAVYRNYGYFGDNGGAILCVNLLTLKPVWYLNNRDDMDASIVIEETGGKPFLYAGCEVDKQGSSGFSYLHKLNGLNGDVVWSDSVFCYSVTKGEKTFNGGLLSTPLLGMKNCEQYVYAVFSQASDKFRGSMIAYHKDTGKRLFTTQLDAYSWSSPVAVCSKNGEMYLFIGDVEGKVYLIDGKTGVVLLKKQIGINFESSPAVYANRIYMGSRGSRMYRLHIE